MTKETGGPAFPTGTQCSQNNTTGETLTYQYLSDGLTLRDYFAAKAMQGELAAMSDQSEGQSSGLDFDVSEAMMARLSNHWYRIADAMLEARK